VTYGLGRYAYGLFVPEIRADYGLGTTVLGIIASGSYGAYLGATALSAGLAERLGARRLVVAGGLATAAGMALVAAGSGVAAAAVGVIVAGSGSGLVWPALSDAVQRNIPDGARVRALALVNSGTSYAVALAGPVALAAGDRWRAAWVVFAGISLTVTAWCAAAVPPTRTHPEALPPFGRALFAREGAAALLAFALASGLGTAMYWTFAADLVADRHGGSATAGQVLMTVVGVAGIAGGAVGSFTARFGLARTLVAGTLANALGTALLPAAAGAWAGVAASAVLFGATFILVAGGAALWTVAIFGDRPAAGIGALTVVFTVGSMVGPAALGAVGGAFGLPVAFGASAAVLTAAALVAARAPRAKMGP